MDGGRDYLRRSFREQGYYTYLSVLEPIEKQIEILAQKQNKQPPSRHFRDGGCVSFCLVIRCVAFMQFLFSF